MNDEDMIGKRYGTAWFLLAAIFGTVVGPAGERAAHATAAGPVSAYGDAPSYGAPSASQLNAPLAGIAATLDGKGYWLVGADGGVFTFGDAAFYGSDGNSGFIPPFVGVAPTPDGHGYWLTADVGIADNFGDAASEGPMPAKPDAPIVGIASDRSEMGYWLAGADGGIFSFGDAGFYGSMGGRPLRAAIVAIASTPDGHGYWLVGADGGVFSFGDAGYHGSLGGKAIAAPIVGVAPTPDGHGYWLVGADGGVFSFGDASFFGSMGATPPNVRTPVVGFAATPDGNGYWLATSDKERPPPTAVPSVLAQCNEPGTAPAVEPSTIILACADANARLTHLVWSTWTATTATATGDFTHNTCEPDCADGTFVSAPATVHLGYPIETGAGREFAMISFTYADPSSPRGSTTDTEVAPTNAG